MTDGIVTIRAPRVVDVAWASGGTGTMRLEWAAGQVALLETAFSG